MKELLKRFADSKAGTSLVNLAFALGTYYGMKWLMVHEPEAVPLVASILTGSAGTLPSTVLAKKWW